MQIVIEIPEKDIPKRGQGMITVHFDFHTGKLCRCTYPCKALPKGHGVLKDMTNLMRGLYEEAHIGEDIYTSGEVYVMLNDESLAPTVLGEADEEE